MIKTLYPAFQRWSNGGSIYIISDTHFDDPDREFMGYNISEQEQLYLINEACHKNDTLIHLGDVGNPEYMNKIKSYKVLITGNHDTGETKKYFDEVYDGPVWIAQKLVLSHEPLLIELFDKYIGITFNIHGHDHNNSFWSDYHLNIAQNVYGYFPLSLKEFIKTGALSYPPSIHRATIDCQIERKKNDIGNN